MEREVGAHSPCYKIVFDESPNKCQLLRSGQFHGKGNFDFTGKLGVAGLLDFLYGVPKRGTVLKLRRGVGGEHDFRMDNAGLVRVVVGLAVPLICQLLAAPVGGSSDSRTAYAPLDDLNGTVKNRYVIFLLPPQSTAGGIKARESRIDAKRMFCFLWRTRGLGKVLPHRVRRTQQPPAGRTTPERCISAP